MSSSSGDSSYGRHGWHVGGPTLTSDTLLDSIFDNGFSADHSWTELVVKPDEPFRHYHTWMHHVPGAMSANIYQRFTDLSSASAQHEAPSPAMRAVSASLADAEWAGFCRTLNRALDASQTADARDPRNVARWFIQACFEFCRSGGDLAGQHQTARCKSLTAFLAQVEERLTAPAPSKPLFVADWL